MCAHVCAAAPALLCRAREPGLPQPGTGERSVTCSASNEGHSESQQHVVTDVRMCKRVCAAGNDRRPSHPPACQGHRGADLPEPRLPRKGLPAPRTVWCRTQGHPATVLLGLGHLVQSCLSPDTLGMADLWARSGAPGLPDPEPEPPAARLWGLGRLSSETPWEELPG